MNVGGKTVQQWMFTTVDQIAFLEQWRSLDEYGLSTRKLCLALIENGTPAMKHIGQAGLDAPANNQQFTDVLVGWLPDVVIAGIAIAIEEGVTQLGLEGAIKQLQGGQRVVSRIAAVLAFPFALTVGVGVLGVFVSSKILNASRSQGGIGQTVLDGVTLWGLPMAIGCVALLVGLAFLLSNWSGTSRQWVNGWPVFTLYKHAVTSGLLATLGNLLSCGMKLDDALRAIEAHSDPFLRDHVSHMRDRNIGQDNLGIILDTGLLLPFELTTLKVLGSEVDYHVLLTKSAARHQQSVNKRLVRMGAVLPKIGLLIAIALLALLIGSAMSQLFSTMQI